MVCQSRESIVWSIKQNDASNHGSPVLIKVKNKQISSWQRADFGKQRKQSVKPMRLKTMKEYVVKILECFLLKEAKKDLVFFNPDKVYKRQGSHQLSE